MPLGGYQTCLMSIDLYGVGPRRDHRRVDLISDALPFGRLWYGEPTRSLSLPWQTYGSEIVEFHTPVAQTFTVVLNCKLCGVLNLKAAGAALGLTDNREVAGECRGTLLI